MYSECELRIARHEAWADRVNREAWALPQLTGHCNRDLFPALMLLFLLQVISRLCAASITRSRVHR